MYLCVWTRVCVQMVPLENNGVISVDWTDDAIANLRDDETEEQVNLHPSCRSGGCFPSLNICILGPNNMHADGARDSERCR